MPLPSPWCSFWPDQWRHHGGSGGYLVTPFAFRSDYLASPPPLCHYGFHRVAESIVIETMKGARGMVGIPVGRHGMDFGVMALLVVMRNLIHSSHGRAIMSFAR